MYRLSVKCLEVLLFGRFTKTSKTTSTHYEELFQPNDNAPLMSALLSRRARGKVADRLIIDCVHLHRALVGALESITKRSAVKCFQTRLTSFCRKLIESVAVSGTMGFSMIRLMARRLKQPLSETLQDVICLESIELGLRYDNRANDANGRSKKYSDWSPVTDRFVANTLANDSMEAGARCSFVGFEDEIESSLCSSSLNVEELAMELYRTGRLPANCELRPLQGGWVGWHDEGSRMRSLFRIMCGAPILGMDFGCAYENLGVREQQEQNTIHLSPYQQAPFDLHVGYEVKGEVGDNCISARGFYKRRSTVIGNFISKLEHSSSQALSDIVFRSVKSRLIHSTTSTVKDPFLERDLMQVRTMSALAAGFGGKLLAASFRCLLFDYRHYSGGLPDLQLFRAVTMSDSTATRAQLVDLGDWIGESFSAESQLVAATARAAAFLSDRDEEYLGCSKFGDSGNQSQPNRDRKPRVSTPKTITIPLHAMPERLLLVHNNRTVQVECMMVEVKSSNDRLDPRQEDWLNILDCHGNARVCKFEDKKKDKNAATRSRVCP